MEVDLLKQHGLYGGGLVDVKSPLLVTRYNRCLEGIGLAPTALKSFQIDGRGWSPQVAEEKKNPAYLGHGGAVQYAILLTPDQKGRPVYQPYFSYERALLAQLFEQADEAIARITKSTGIWVQIDPGLSELTQLSDIVMVKNIVVTLGDPESFIREAETQRELVIQFSARSDAWTDETLRQKLAASGQKFGDLRFALPFKAAYEFDDTACFFTPLMGGVFVFRSNSETKSLLVVCDEEVATQGETGAGFRVSYLQKKSLLSRLLALGLVEIPIEWHRKNVKQLEKLREEMLVAVAGNETDFTKFNDAQWQHCAMQHRKNLPDEYAALERLEQRLTLGEAVDVQHLTLRLKWILARPVEGLSVSVVNTVWKLICRVAPVGLATRFAYDKPVFFKDFGAWPENRKRWAVATIIAGGLAPRRKV